MRCRKLLSIGVATAAPGLLGLSAAALAHEPPADEGERKEMRRVIILEGGHGKTQAEGRPGRLLPGRAELVARCAVERSEIADGTDTERRRIVICSDDHAGGADRVARLEEALGRIRREDHLSPEHRARVETALQQAIDRLRQSR